MASKIYRFLIDLVYPNRCGFCDSVIPWNELICPKCKKELLYSYSPGRRDEKERFVLCLSPCFYQGVAKDGVINLKYRYGYNAAEYLLPELVSLIKQHIREDIDIITAVPMTYKRRSQTGYNQAQIIAKLLSKELKLPYDGRLLAKNKSAAVQHKLNAKERRKLIRGAYTKGRSNYDLKGKVVLIADDVITTGATLSECAKVLKSIGAKRVYCCTLAQTVKGS